jgi:hypothetical protein
MALQKVSPLGEALAVQKIPTVKPVTVDFDAPVERV